MLEGAGVGSLAGMPEVQLTAAQERDFLAACLRAAGAREDVAAVAAEQMTEADLRGYGSHGVIRLAYLIRSLQHGTANGDPAPRTLTETGGTALLDGDRGLGGFVGRHAITLATEKAAESGIAIVGVRNSHYTGLLAYFAQLAVDRGMVACISSSTPPMVHPYGGGEAALGTAPLCLAVPCEPTPIILDMATSQAARGKIMAAQRDGRSIPPDWAIDADGAPTTEPDAALAGALSPFGGPKGGGLAALLHFLTGPLLGFQHSTQADAGVFSGEVAIEKGDVYLVIDPGAFGASDAFRAAARDYAATLRATAPAPGRPRVRLPGDRAMATRRERLRDGITIAAGVWEEAVGVASALDVAAPAASESGADEITTGA